MKPKSPYKIEPLFSKKADLSKLDEDMKENVELIKKASENFSIEDPDARQMDNFIFQDIKIEFPDIFKSKKPKKSPKESAWQKKKKDISLLGIKHFALNPIKEYGEEAVKKASADMSALAYMHSLQKKHDLTADPKLPELKKEDSFKKGMDKLDECRKLIAADRKKKESKKAPEPKPQARTVFKTAGSKYANRIFKLVKAQGDDLSLAKKVKNLMIRQEIQMNELIFGRDISKSDENALREAIDERYKKTMASLLKKKNE